MRISKKRNIPMKSCRQFIEEIESVNGVLEGKTRDLVNKHDRPDLGFENFEKDMENLNKAIDALDKEVHWLKSEFRVGIGFSIVGAQSPNNYIGNYKNDVKKLGRVFKVHIENIQRSYQRMYGTERRILRNMQ